MNKARERYLYWPVAGASVWWREADTMKRAKAALRTLRQQHPGYDFEIERVLLLNNNARRYWRRRNGKWSTENHFDPTAADLAHWAEWRKP